MKHILLAAAAALITTVAQAEVVVHVKPGTSISYHTTKPFKIAISGDEGLLTVHAGATDHDLIIVANQPDGTIAASSNIIMIDDNGKLVENLRVEVSPFDESFHPIYVHGKTVKTYWCNPTRCIYVDAVKSRNKDIGDADSITVTTNKDGSTVTGKTWITPPSE